MYKNLNPDALEDLYRCCRNALGAYDALKLMGAEEELPGFDRCLSRLKEAIKKADYDSNAPILKS